MLLQNECLFAHSSLYKTYRMNMRLSDAPAGKRFVALLAVVSLHLLVLAALRNTPSPNSVQSVPEDKLLVITSLPPESPAVLPLAVIEKRPHVLPLLRYSSKKPTAFQNSAPAIDATSHVSAPEEKPRVEAVALEESKAKTAEPAG